MFIMFLILGVKRWFEQFWNDKTSYKFKTAINQLHNLTTDLDDDYNGSLSALATQFL